MPESIEESRFFPPKPDRSVFLNKTVDVGAFNDLFPQICHLRDRSDAPIFLYLDSFGGDVRYAEKLHELLKAPRHDGSVCKVVAVIPQMAASAAADLAILSDFSTIYPGGIIYCHGTRLSPDEVTVDNVHKLEEYLRGSNEHHAGKLARRIFGRIAFLLWLNREGFTEAEELALPKKADESELLPDENLVVRYFKYLLEQDKKSGVKLSPKGSEFASRVLGRWKKKHRLLAELNFSTEAENPVEVWAPAILEQILKRDPAPETLKAAAKSMLDDASLAEEMLKAGGHGLSGKLVSQFGFFFLSEIQQKKFSEIENIEEQEKFLAAHALKHAQITFLFVMNLCQTLHEDENPFKSIDAYHLGLVDEIYGMAEIYPSSRSMLVEGEASLEETAR